MPKTPRKWTQQALRGKAKELENPLQSASEDLLAKFGILTVHLKNRCQKCGFVDKRYTGYPDVILIGGGIELKVNNKKQTPEQEDIEELFKHFNIKYTVCRNTEEVLEYARAYRENH